MGGNQVIVPEENYPQVRVMVWVEVSFGVGGGNFPRGNCLCMVEIYQQMLQSNNFNRVSYLTISLNHFSNSDDALLVRAKRQILRKNIDYSTGFVFNYL